MLSAAQHIQVNDQYRSVVTELMQKLMFFSHSKLRWPINYVYFWYSMLYLVGRTACVFLTAATINDESKSALGVLRRVSSKNWCVEVERLIFQMSTQTVALSGKKFYFLTRRLLFGVRIARVLPTSCFALTFADLLFRWLAL